MLIGPMKGIGPLIGILALVGLIAVTLVMARAVAGRSRPTSESMSGDDEAAVNPAGDAPGPEGPPDPRSVRGPESLEHPHDVGELSGEEHRELRRRYQGEGQ